MTEPLAFRVECPACKKIYTGTCGVHTKLTTEERKSDE